MDTLNKVINIALDEENVKNAQKQNSDTTVLQVCKPYVSSLYNMTLGVFSQVLYSENSSDNFMKNFLMARNISVFYNVLIILCAGL